MRIVLTGAAGFLGSHLAHRFLEDGHEVLGVDNLVTGSGDNVTWLQEWDGFAFRLHDVSIPLFVKGPVDGVLHFASAASPVDYLELPIQTLKVGSLGTHNMLGLARAKRAKFLLASTSEVYGDPEVHPQVEGYWGNVNPIGPRGVYDEAKRFAEAMAMAYHRVHEIPVRIARIFNTYGPRMRPGDGRVVSNFVVQALRGEPLTVYGDGSQTRSFCYVDDLVEGLVRLYDCDFVGPVNLGNPREYTVLDLARTVLSLVESRSGIEERPLPQDDPKVRRPDISLAQRLFDWTPEIGLQEGLQRTLPYLRDRVERADAKARPLT
ncbi:MAG: UDP-glucuronic acid decarboxylase family protein [Gemmatimonadota bacterium]